MSKLATSVLQRPSSVRARWPESLTPERLESMREPTPVLACDPSAIEARYRHMRECLPGVDVFYAVKSNPDPGVLTTLSRVGAGFEIASFHELELVEAAGGSAAGALYSNPVKPPHHITASYRRGVRRFGFDGECELRKLAAHAPGSQVYVRLKVDDHHSLFPLSQKFGTSVDEGCRLLLLARELGLDPYGVTFHVGSQCADPNAWPRAIAQCGVLFGMLHRQGVTLQMLDIGGGFPGNYCDPIPEFSQIARGISGALDRMSQRPPIVVAEPGRYLVAESGVMVSTVIGVDRRSDGLWCYLDVGGYNGLMETVQTGGRWKFPLRTSKDGDAPMVPFTVTGPTCDSSDTMFYDAHLPADLEVGDRVYIGSAGAYTTSYASSFNGFPPPRMLFTDGGNLMSEW
ncbi:MAG: type III PLP-dependent enzyme [Acidimicrobiales bacterium]